MDRQREPLEAFFAALLEAYGPQRWWPAETSTEVVIGAILTQNTSWKNVERAIAALRAAGALNFARLHAMDAEQIAELIRPAGTFRVKAARLKAFVDWLHAEYGGRMQALADVPTETLRGQLLAIRGIGPETADAILLYALERPTFVVDAYTRRVLVRHGVADLDADYDTLKVLFEDALPPERQVFNEYHALLVEVGKGHCRARARCEGCPLERFPHNAEAI